MWNPLAILSANPNKAMDIADKTIGHVASGLDKLHFSDQEKAGVNIKAAELVIELHKANSDQNSIRSRVRRYLAVMIVALAVLAQACGSSGESGTRVIDEKLSSWSRSGTGDSVVDVSLDATASVRLKNASSKSSVAVCSRIS